MPDSIGPDLDEAREKIETTRQALQAVLDDQGGPESIRQALGRLERMTTEVARIEAVVVAQGMVARNPAN